MEPSAACNPRLAARALAAAAMLAALAVASGCGGASGDAPTTVERLAQPASTWAGLTIDQQRAEVGLCRLNAAAAIAQTTSSAASAPAVAPSGAYQATLALPTPRLRKALTERFADPSHAGERVADGCRAVLADAVARAGIGRAPTVDFGPPMETTDAGLRLTVRGSAATIPARVTPARGARLTVTPAPGRAGTTANIAVRQRGGRATLRLTRVPRGTSYLRATVTTDAKTTAAEIVLHGTSAPKLPEPRTFAPMRIHGDGSRGLTQFYLPQDGRATVTTEGAPLVLAAGGTVLLAHAAGAPATPVVIPAGRYRDVTVRTSGEWAIRIVPAR